MDVEQLLQEGTIVLNFWPVKSMPVRYVGSTVPLKLPIQLRSWQASAMRPLRYSINVTLDGCCDHPAMITDEELHRHAIENLAQADAFLLAG